MKIYVNQEIPDFYKKMPDFVQKLKITLGKNNYITVSD